MIARWERGFTMIELAIVLVIAGLIAGVAGPKLADGLRQQSVRAAADQFVLAHSLARSTALRYGRVAELRIDAAGTRFWVEVDTSGTGVRDTVGFVRNPADAGVKMTSTRTLLCFDARGLATTGGACQPGDATVVFASSSRAATVRVTTLGKVLR
ncbi:MAG TPA: GspH/FimT family pseudopilin [Gemmatimonadales bacterium]|nr:GspH/FimT family pseudopilin [Gemmatimonadales bacterium]